MATQTESTHMDVIDGYLAKTGMKSYLFDNLIGTKRGVASKIVNGDQILKPKVALRIERATGLDAVDLLCRQAKWQLEKLRSKKDGD